MSVIGKSGYVNRIETEECPCCGKERPLDWFDLETGLCWSCKPRTPRQRNGYRWAMLLGCLKGEPELIG